MSSDVIQFPVMAKALTATPLGGTNLLGDDIKMSDLYGSSQSPAETSLAPKAAPRAIATDLTEGWSNQELADLYRTHRLLALAGITTEIDHGLTDENDPWFVFIDSQEEVFVHFSRFDGGYMVTSQVQEKPVWGNSLADLVSEFSKWVQPTTEVGSDRRNVVSIAGRSHNAVLIHPSAALAALVWSIYLMSDELVAAAPLVVPDFAGGVPQTDLPSTTADIDVLPDLAQKAMTALTYPTLAKQMADPYHGYHGREIGIGAQLAILPSGLSMKAVALGLSLAALYVGLPLTDKDTSSEANGPLLSIKEMVTHIKEATLSALASIEVIQEARGKLHDEVNNSAPLPLVIPDIEIKASETSGEFSEVIQATTSSYEAGIEAILPPQQEIATGMPKEAETTSEAQAPASAEDTTKDTTKDTTLSVDAGLLHRFDEAFESFALTSIETLAQPEVAQLMTLNTVSEVDVPLDDALQPGQYAPFDDDARMFLDFLLRSYDDIKVMSMPNEIIFIHVDAFDVADTEHPIYAKSWSFDDGGVVSTIGLKSDMEMFDLIA